MRIFRAKEEAMRISEPGRLHRSWIWLKYGIKSTARWLPVIWADRDWDYFFFYKIMRHKIAGMHDASKTWIGVDREERTEELSDVLGLLDYLLEDTHEKKAHEEHEKIFGPSKWEFDPIDDSPFCELHIVYPEANDQEQAKRALMAFLNMAGVARQATLDALARAISSRSEYWWD